MARENPDFEIEFFERLVKEDPHFVDALLPLAELYTRKGFHEKALELDLRLSKLRPEDSTVHYNLACSFALAGRKKEALQTLERAIRLGYNDMGHMKKDADLKIIWEDPRFQFLAASTTPKSKRRS